MFTEINKLFKLREKLTLLPTFITDCKAKFQIEVSENKVVISSHPPSRTPD